MPKLKFLFTERIRIINFIIIIIMSQCIVPNWNLRHQRQEQDEEEEEGNRRSSHVNNNTTTNTLHHQQHNSSPHFFPMSNYEVAELTWQNGQLAMHGLGGLPPTTPTKPTWGRSSETLESIVHQATSYPKQNLNLLPHDTKTPAKNSSMIASSCEKWSEGSGKVPALLKKRARGDSDHQCGKNFNGSTQEDQRVDRSPCASVSATFCRDNDTTMMTWASYESPRSFKAKTTDEDSACHDESENQDEDHENKAETVRSHSSRRSRAAAIHNQSERRRRDRINQKMKALQRLVPNASKTDKASMLDEVIDYLKKLQAQVQMMNSMRNNIPQMMMPLGMQQHLQMSLLARMAAGMGAVGLGMGMGTTMFDLNSMARSGGTPQGLPALVHHPSTVSTTTPNPFVPTPFMMPSMIATCPPAQVNPDHGDSNASVSLPDPYCALFAQSMNMELYNKMAALFRQQGDQATQAMNCPSQQPNPVQGD